MTANINNWNVDPNIKWFVKIGPSGDQGLTQLFKTQADAEAETNRVAYGAFEFGDAVDVVLTNDTTPPDVEIFNDYHTYHLKATLYESDPAKIFEMGPYTDLPDISDPLLVESQAILDRATREIDEHTHTKIFRDSPLGTHFTDLDIGEISRLRDDMRGLDTEVRMEEIITRGDKDSLLDTIKTVQFEDVKR